ncbi:hypothetical protein [Cupriavidus metallidurans]|uniref:hypothetical protein n=1 Tax=Cupriavidus metallidurans TaxID=119219 RepID=UPI000037C6C5|nr:hypothetical protein [Cupriavidus metallidurans]
MTVYAHAEVQARTRGNDTYVFAISLDMPNPGVAPKRQEIARAVLKQVGALS